MSLKEVRNALNRRWVVVSFCHRYCGVLGGYREVKLVNSKQGRIVGLSHVLHRARQRDVHRCGTRLSCQLVGAADKAIAVR